VSDAVRTTSTKDMKSYSSSFRFTEQLKPYILDNRFWSYTNIANDPKAFGNVIVFKKIETDLARPKAARHSLRMERNRQYVFYTQG